MNPCGKGMDSEKLHDELLIGAGYIAKGVRDSAWHDAMTKEFGPEIKPYLSDMYARSKATYDTAMETALAKKIKARDVRLEKRAAEYEERIKTGDFAKRIREKLPISGESLAKQKAFEAARNKFESFVRQKEFDNQGPLRRFGDRVVALARWSKLTGIETIGKIGTAATVRIAQRTVESAFNEAVRHVPYIGHIWKGAGVEGAGLAELPQYIRGAVRGIGDIPGVLKGKVTTSERIQASPFRGKVTSALDATSIRLHAAGKRPAYRAAYDHAKTYLTKEARILGKDLSDPEVLTQIDDAARAAGDRSIFLRDNLASKSLSVLVNYLERQKLAPMPGFVAAKILRFLLPIVRVPTNIAGETLSMSGGGLISGTFKTARIMGKSLDMVSQVEKASIVRSYKKGMIGAGLFATGFLLKDHFGRPYDPHHPANQGEPHEGEAQLFGVRIPKWMMHAPPVLTMQAGADTAHLLEDKFKKNGQLIPGKNLATAYGIAIQHVLREVPFVKEVSTLDSLLGGGWDSNPSKELGKQLVGVVPQALQNVAKWTDTHDNDTGGWPWGYPVQRSPQNPLQQLEMTVPGLRQQVPLKSSLPKSRRSSSKTVKTALSAPR